MYSSRLRNSQGEIIAGIEAVRDVTERKRLEAELQDQKRFAESVIENSAVATFVLSPEHAATIAGDGMSKQAVKEFLFEHARIPLGKFSKENIARRFRSKLAAQQAKPADAESDDVVIFMPSAQNEGQNTTKAYGKNGVEPLVTSSAAAAGTTHNALRSSIIGGLAVWVAGKSVERAAKKATMKAEKAAR